MPSDTLFACVASDSTWLLIQRSAGPWQASHDTPSASWKPSPRWAGLGLCVWQSRHRSLLCAGSESPSFLAISFERSFSSTEYDRACLSERDHVMYSFCRTLESFHVSTAP